MGSIWKRVRQPDARHTYNQDPKISVHQQRYVLFAGLAAFSLPVILGAGGWITCHYTALSQYYYDPIFGTVFVGTLFFVCALMAIYKGDSWQENKLLSLGGIFALGIAIFPTTGRGCFTSETYNSRLFLPATYSDTTDLSVTVEKFIGPDGKDIPPTPFHLFADVQLVHAISTGMFLLILVFFCAVVFPSWKPGRKQGREKRVRNWVYRICTFVMVVSALILLDHELKEHSLLGKYISIEQWRELRITFYAEAAILWGFGFSWMTKGRVIRWLRDPEERAELEKLEAEHNCI